MLAGAFVARRRRMHCRGSDTAAKLAVEREQRRRAIPRGGCQHRRRRAEADPGGGAHAEERLQGQQRDGGRRAAEQVPAAAPPTTTTTREAVSRSARDEDETESARSSAELCAVCLEDVRGAAEGAASLLPCSHAYHPACVRPWLAVRRACPCCRAAVPPSPEESEDTA